jgi:hypothetical protein
MKIDTQGMSFGTGKGDGRSLEEQRAAIPPIEAPKTKLFSDAFRKELKELINEILDERNDKVNLKG